MKALVFEDDREVVRDLSFCLQVRYPEVIVISVGDTLTGIEMVETEFPDIVIVDTSLHDVDTLDLVSNIREFSNVPLIILSDSKADVDVAQGLEAGADEYITKPFSPIELLARVKALLRRTQGFSLRPERVVSYSDGLTINFTTRQVFLSGRRIKLTPIEYRLLSELITNEGRVLTHSSLLEKVWGSGYISDSSLTKKYIYRLRQKLRDDSDDPRMIHTEHGVGYRFMIPA